MRKILISRKFAEQICKDEGLSFIDLRLGRGPLLLKTGAKLFYDRDQATFRRYGIYGYAQNSSDVQPYIEAMFK